MKSTTDSILDKLVE